jgi:predicted metalloprotease
MSEIDSEKDVYLFTHGRMDLQEKSVNALLAKGFSKEKIITAMPDKLGSIGDYMAMLWMPPNPDHIKIQKITNIQKVESVDVTGLWKGVSKEDLFTIPLE